MFDAPVRPAAESIIIWCGAPYQRTFRLRHAARGDQTLPRAAAHAAAWRVFGQGLRDRAASRHAGPGAGRVSRDAGLRSGRDAAGTNAGAVHRAHPLATGAHPGGGPARYGPGTGRYHDHAIGRLGGVLPAHSRGPRGGRIAHRRSRAALSGGDEPRGDHPPCHPPFRPYRAGCRLAAEGVAGERIFVTGNSGIDAVLLVRDALASGAVAAAPWTQLDATKKLIVVTAHRRESFCDGFERICAALVRLARRDDVQIAYPVHRNPNVLEPVHRLLAGQPNILLLDPLDYIPFVDLMRRATLILTDSGGIQEEGPSLGKPILVLREKTERPEAVEAGTVKLVGTDEEKIVSEAVLLLDDEAQRQHMSRVHNPYGDGEASRRIADAIAGFRQGLDMGSAMGLEK